MGGGARTARSVSHVSERQRYVIEYFACSYSLFIHTRTHVFPTTTQTFVRSAVLVQLFELHPACVGETRELCSSSPNSPRGGSK